MTFHAKNLRNEVTEGHAISVGPGQGSGSGSARIPCLAIHFFSETATQSSEIEQAIADRRMARANVKKQAGSIEAVIGEYRNAPTPDLLVIESSSDSDKLMAQLDALASVCDAKTKVILLGPSNDIDLYRAVLKRGVSEYIRVPANAVSIMSAIAGLYAEPSAAKLGRVYAFVGARGGVGSSTLAHNLAWTLGRSSGSEVIIADLDIAFGTADLNFDLQPEVGIAEAMLDPGRLDDQMLERLVTRCGDHLKLLPAPALLNVDASPDPSAFEVILDVAQRNFAHVVLDLPHLWSDWARRTLVSADEVVITATPDLASLRNARNLVEFLRKARPNDPDPRLVLNQVGVAKRPEIKQAQFAEVLKLTPLASIPFDGRVFGTAATTGRMLPDVAKRGPYAAVLRQLAETLAGRPMERRRPFALFERMLGRRGAGRAAG